MSWNHRVMRFSNDSEEWFGVHEVYYHEDGRLRGYTTEAVNVMGETVEELRAILERMLASLNKPILTADDFKGEEK